MLCPLPDSVAVVPGLRDRHDNLYAHLLEAAQKNAVQDNDVECQRRENELRVRKDVLRADQTTIRGQLDRLNSRYKTILCGRYVYSDPSLQKGWKTIARELRKTEITAQRWEKFALVVLGSMLDEVPMVEELLSRAYDARD